MTTLVWDETGKHFYETAINKGVFYDSSGLGTSWNGLTSIEETVTNSIQPIHYDGLKFNDIVTNGDFTGVLKAWTYPLEFLPYEGIIEEQRGFFVSAQPQGKFGLSYQTKIGNEIEGLDFGYKIHLLYNLTALPSQKTYQTLSDTSIPLEFEWTITGIPEAIENYRPTVHVIFDSTRLDPWLLEDLEGILYGDEDSDAYLPPLKGLATWVRKWDRLIIIDHGDGTWTAESPREEDIIMLDETTFQITSETAIYLDEFTYEISSSDKNNEDVIPPWQL
jgi:hypothetical protein